MTEMRKTTDGMTCDEMRSMIRANTFISRTNVARARRAQLVAWMDSHRVLEIVAGRKADRRLTTADINEAHRLAHAEARRRTPVPHIADAEITDNGDGTYTVRGTWTASAPLDRPESSGYAVRDRRLAERLAAAMRAGAVFTNPEVKIDVNGKTYVSSGSAVLGRTANADLRRLGY